MIARGSWLMPRPGWFAGWDSCCWWAVRGNADGGKPLMHDHRESDDLVIPAKPPNKPGLTGGGGGGGKEIG